MVRTWTLAIKIGTPPKWAETEEGALHTREDGPLMWKWSPCMWEENPYKWKGSPHMRRCGVLRIQILDDNVRIVAPYHSIKSHFDDMTKPFGENYYSLPHV